MGKPDFDVIVVGGGIAGTVAAYQLAGQGHAVALLERGESAGSKNLSGGILYARAMSAVFPDFLDAAPIERRISQNQLCFLNQDSWVGVDYGDQRLYRGGTAVSVLRARLDPWLAERCEEAGVAVMPGVRVDALVQEASRIVGVRAGEDELRSRVVIAADGVNSFLARDIGLRAKPRLNHQAVGIKAVVKLDTGRIEDRFGVTGDDGKAFALVGDCTRGVAGGAFLYTNRDSVSLGVVLRLDDLVATGLSSPAVFDHFLEHPFVARYIDGGELLEYGAHLVNEGGTAMAGRRVADGLVVVGDAAGLTINTGLTVRGMDLAAGSAVAAATAIHDALVAGDTSAAGLAGYERHLATSFVGQDTTTYARAPRFFEDQRLYTDVGPLLAQVLYSVFNLDGTPRRRFVPTARAALKGSPLSLAAVAGLAAKAARAL